MANTGLNSKEKKGMIKAVFVPNEIIDILAMQAAKDRRSLKSFMELILIRAAEDISKNELSEK